MGTLKNTNEGWNRERFVENLVGRLAYIQSPDKLGDDFGVDLIGFFKVDHPNRSDMYVPSMPFHLQVKPKNDPTFIAKHIHELTQLYAPFYFAVGNTKKQTVTVYSGLGIVGLSMIDNRSELCRKVDAGEIKVILNLSASTGSEAGRPRFDDQGNLVIDFYRVAVLTPSTEINSEDVARWRRDCTAVMRSIESFNSGEFVLESYVGTVTQVIGIGTYSHALKRMLHASAMIAHVINNGNDFIGGLNKRDTEFIMTLRKVAEYIETARSRLVDPSVLSNIIVAERWKAWFNNVVGTARNWQRHNRLSESHNEENE